MRTGIRYDDANNNHAQIQLDYVWERPDQEFREDLYGINGNENPFCAQYGELQAPVRYHVL